MQLPPYHEWVNRRQLFTAAGLAAVTDVAAPTPLPSGVGASDVRMAHESTLRLRAVAWSQGGAPVAAALQTHAAWVEGLLDARQKDVIRYRMLMVAALAHAAAGWNVQDIGQGDPARAHMHRALALAKGTPVLPEVLYMAARIEGHRGDPNYALKLMQLGEVARQAAPGTPAPEGVVVDSSEQLRATIAADAAKLYATVGAIDQARGHLDAAADSDDAFAQGVAAEARMMLGELDTARELAQGAVAGRDAGTARSAVPEHVTAACVLLRQHEVGAALPHVQGAVAAVRALPGSVRSAERLRPLCVELVGTRDSAVDDLRREAFALSR
jgi:tetratricopeptide (TPR) repeat protein